MRKRVRKLPRFLYRRHHRHTRSFGSLAECRESRTDARHYDRPAQQFEDSAFVKLPFVRTSRTNDKKGSSRFVISLLEPIIFLPLNDVNRDYKFDQPGEDIAFLDSVIVPSFELTTRQDTTWKDSLTIDTIRTVGYTRFFPDNIELRLFKEKFERQYMVKPERPDEKYFTLRFNTKLDTVPVPVPINFTPGRQYLVFCAADGRRRGR